MATVDSIAGEYRLETIGQPYGTGDIRITAVEGTGNIILEGNLFVIGTFSNVQSYQTLIYDNFITLNAEAQGVPTEHAGIEVERGIEPKTGIRWNEILDQWEFTNDGTIWWRMLRRLKDDPDPHLGGNLYTDCYHIKSEWPCNIIFTPGENEFTANGALEITHVDLAVANVAYVANATVLYGGEPENGNTGLYITDKQARAEELITKRKAVIYSLVL